MRKSLDVKLAEIHATPASPAFILADAKDADMAYGISATGREKGKKEYRTLEEYREVIRQNVRQGLIDIMLMSVSTSEALTIRERLFDGSIITPAVRANDTTDIHVGRAASYAKEPARPFRTALIDHAMGGRLDCTPQERTLGADLGLYSVTFNNDLAVDLRTLETYKEFRIEAERKGFRHFLEVFDPNAAVKPVPPDLLGGFINDLIVRTLAGVAAAGRPIFLKIAYHGPRSMEEIARYDRHLVPGILGGGGGTTHDAFKMLADARKYGAKAALYGRKINNAEHQLTFIQHLRRIADGQCAADEAVKAYHADLAALKIQPHRPLKEDLQITYPYLLDSAGKGGKTFSVPASTGYAATTGYASTGYASSQAGSGSQDRPSPNPASQTPSPKPAAPKPAQGAGRGANATPEPANYPLTPDGRPDFAKMTPEQRLAYHQARLKRLG